MADGAGTPLSGKQYSRRTRTPKKFFDIEVEDTSACKTNEKKNKVGKKSSDIKPRNNSKSANKKKKKQETPGENNETKEQSAKDIQRENSAGLDRIVSKESNFAESSVLEDTDLTEKASNISKPTKKIKTDIIETKVGNNKCKSKPRNSLRSLNEARTNEIVDEEIEERIIANASEVDKIKEMVKSLRNKPKRRKKSPILKSDKLTERIPEAEKPVSHEITEHSALVDNTNTYTKGIEEGKDVNKDKTTANDVETIQKDCIPLECKDRSNDVETAQKDGTPLVGKKRGRRKGRCDRLNELTVSDSSRQNTQATSIPIEKDITKDSENTTKGHLDAIQNNANKTIKELAKKTPSSGRKMSSKRKGSDDINDDNTSEKNEPSVSETPQVEQSVAVSRSGRKRRVLNYSAYSKHSVDESEVVKTKRSRKSTIKDGDNEGGLADQREGKKTPKTSIDKPEMTQDKVLELQVDEYRCQKCEYVSASASHMKLHAAYTHQTHWTVENPEGSTDKAAMTQVIKIRKYLNCPKCDKRLNFVQYYHKHVEWCGRESETYMCDMCGSPNLKAMWKNVHKQQCTKVREELLLAQMKADKLREAEQKDKNISGKKRSAAKKALTMLQDLSNETGLDQESEKSDSDPDAEIDETEETDEDDCDDEGDNEKEINDKLENSETEEEELVIHIPKPKQKVMYIKYWPTYTAMKKFVAKNYSQELYETWLPRKQSWTALPPSESERYLPSNKSSVQFTFRGPNNCVTLGLYETNTSTAAPIFYTGMAVWKLAWCPMPLNHKGNQYLAVIGKRDQQDAFSTSEQTAGPGSIQIWDTNISTNAMQKNLEPRLCYTIAHELGRATALQWCPSGCYNSTTNTNLDPDCVLRLGLLAVSFSDGTVRIFSLPHPDKSSESEAAPTYKPDPVACLVPKRAWQKGCAVCSCFDWSQAKGHTKFVAGYSDGTIALFCLSEIPTQLTLQTSPSLVLLPFHRFYPFGNLVRSVRFCAPSETRIVAGSEDFETYFMDVNSTSVPVMADQPTAMTVNLASSLWHHGIFQACDDNYAVAWNRTRYLESSSLTCYSIQSVSAGERKDELLAYNIASQNACIWDVTVSNWLNYVISCDNKGTMCGIPLQDMTLAVPDQKTYRFRQVIHTTSVQKINKGERDSSSETSDVLVKDSCKSTDENSSAKSSAEIPQESTETDVNPSMSEHLPNSSVNGPKNTENSLELGAKVQNRLEGKDSDVDNQSKSNSEVGVSFCDNDTTTCSEENEFLLKYSDYFKGERQGLVVEKECDIYSRFPVAALTTVAFNPNHKQCLWVAFGGQQGLIRLLNIYKLLPHKMQFLLKQMELQKPS